MKAVVYPYFHRNLSQIIYSHDFEGYLQNDQNITTQLRGRVFLLVSKQKVEAERFYWSAGKK